MYLTDKTPTEFVVYIYASKQNSPELRDFRCPRCGRVVFRTNSTKIFITNQYGINVKDLPPSSNYIAHKCHSCKALYNILFQ
jgi:phage FluMu protein Com